MRKLILTDTTLAPMISLLPQRQPLVVEPSANLIDMLNEFQLARSHFALVVSDANKVKRRWALGTPLDEGDVLGLITCDDVLEELIGELADEEDLERAKVRRSPRSPGAVLVNRDNAACCV
jgi:CBS domain containing-hemolysin-like protein